jgi:hypothetical protein
MGNVSQLTIWPHAFVVLKAGQGTTEEEAFGRSRIL